METAEYRTRFNIMTINNIQTFASIRGGMNGECKDVYFIRGIGCGANYSAEIEAMDKRLWDREQSGRGRYRRVAELPRLTEPDAIAEYQRIVERWDSSGKRELILKVAMDQPPLADALVRALVKVQEEFGAHTPNASSTMEKNFMIKLLFWLERTAGGLLESWTGRDSDKFVFSGKIKKQEYLFGYLLTLLGIDVLLLLPAGEAEVDSGLQKLSAPMVLGPAASTDAAAIPQYTPDKYQAEREQLVNRRLKVDVRRPDREAKRAGMATPSQSPAPSGTKVPAHPGRVTAQRREMEFEELALLASSVVMITVHDQKGDVLGTGSGIMIGPDGFILTNNHVAAGGRFYSVRIEDDEKIYKTDEVIKYNSVQDLAVIRIDRKLKPIPLYQGHTQLARGQKVVAIGSPLGLFNSVSNGIISGFRQLNNVDMIQFTAPISHGSSGGAVLNMYGEVIGISTAGFDGGQNINLAVEYRCINNFVRGFV